MIPNDSRSFRPDSRPSKRHKASAAEWETLRAVKLGPCRVCAGASGLPPTLHHLVGKDLGGSDVAANLVSLCGSGTTGCHGLVEHRDLWACGMLRDTLSRQELGYILATKSALFLGRYYPRRTEAA